MQKRNANFKGPLFSYSIHEATIMQKEVRNDNANLQLFLCKELRQRMLVIDLEFLK